MNNKELHVIKEIVKDNLIYCYFNYKFALFILISGIYTIMKIPYFQEPSLVVNKVSIHFLEGIILNFNNSFYITAISMFFLFNVLEIICDRRLSLLTIVRVKKRSIYNKAKLISLCICSVIHGLGMLILNILINMYFLDTKFTWSNFADEYSIKFLRYPITTVIISFLLIILWFIFICSLINLLNILINNNTIITIIAVLVIGYLQISSYFNESKLAFLKFYKLFILRFQNTADTFISTKVAFLLLVSIIVVQQGISKYFIRKKNFYR